MSEELATKLAKVAAASAALERLVGIQASLMSGIQEHMAHIKKLHLLFEENEQRMRDLLRALLSP